MHLRENVVCSCICEEDKRRKKAKKLEKKAAEEAAAGPAVVTSCDIFGGSRGLLPCSKFALIAISRGGDRKVSPLGSTGEQLAPESQRVKFESVKCAWLLSSGDSKESCGSGKTPRAWRRPMAGSRCHTRFHPTACATTKAGPV